MKKSILLTLTLSMVLAVSSSVLAADSTHTKTLKEPATSGEKSPKTVLVPDQVFTLTMGEANIAFRYQGYSDAKIHLKNQGNRSITYRVTFLDDNRNLMRATLAPGKAHTWTFPLWDVYGSISHGLWNIYAYSSDGSEQDLRVSIYTSEE